MRVWGARVRGRKHKHEGTNCDDWFEVAVAGAWTVIAVADGGGSYALSRVGAREATRAAVCSLGNALGELRLGPQTALSSDLMHAPDVQAASDGLCTAMTAAYEAVERTAAERQLPVAQFHTTLLLAIQTQLVCDGTPYSLVLSCAVGDGMVGVIDRTGKCRLLMQPDGGQYAGEVEFLSSRMVAPERLAARIFPFVGTLRALMVMTDGVADDFFPNDPGMARLYGDLVLNGIVPVSGASKERGTPSTLDTSGEQAKEAERCSGDQTQAGSLCHCVGSRESPGFAEFAETGYRLLPEGDMALVLASAQRYAEALRISAEELASRPELLAAGVARCPMPLAAETDPEKRLLVWLDAYHVRGSFDDRTLVVLCPREGA